MDEYKRKIHQPARNFKTKYSAKPAKKRSKIRQTEWLLKLVNKLRLLWRRWKCLLMQAYKYVHIVKLT